MTTVELATALTALGLVPEEVTPDGVFFGGDLHKTADVLAKYHADQIGETTPEYKAYLLAQAVGLPLGPSEVYLKTLEAPSIKIAWRKKLAEVLPE